LENKTRNGEFLALLPFGKGRQAGGLLGSQRRFARTNPDETFFLVLAKVREQIEIANPSRVVRPRFEDCERTVAALKHHAGVVRVASPRQVVRDLPEELVIGRQQDISCLRAVWPCGQTALVVN